MPVDGGEIGQIGATLSFRANYFTGLLSRAKCDALQRPLLGAFVIRPAFILFYFICLFIFFSFNTRAALLHNTNASFYSCITY